MRVASVDTRCFPGSWGGLLPAPPPAGGPEPGGGAPRLLSPACRQVADCTCPHPGALGGPPQKQRLRQGHGCGESGRGIGVLGRPKQSTSDWGIGTTETCSGPALRAGGPRCGCGPALAGRGARPRPLPAPGAAGPPADTSARRCVPGHVALSSVCPVLIKAPVVGRALVQWDFVLTNHISRDCISKSGPFWGPGGHELRRILFDPVQGRCPRSRGTGGGRVEDGKADEVFCWPGGPRSQPHWGPPQRMWDAPLNCPFEGRGAGHLSLAPRPWAACPLAEQASPWRHAEHGRRAPRRARGGARLPHMAGAAHGRRSSDTRRAAAGSPRTVLASAQDTWFPELPTVTAAARALPGHPGTHCGSSEVPCLSGLQETLPAPAPAVVRIKRGPPWKQFVGSLGRVVGGHRVPSAASGCGWLSLGRGSLGSAHRRLLTLVDYVPGYLSHAGHSWAVRPWAVSRPLGRALLVHLLVFGAPGQGSRLLLSWQSHFCSSE